MLSDARNLITNEIYKLSSELKFRDVFLFLLFSKEIYNIRQRKEISLLVERCSKNMWYQRDFDSSLLIPLAISCSDWFFCALNLQFKAIESVFQSQIQCDQSKLLTKNTIFQSNDSIRLPCSSSMFNKRLNIHQFYSVNEPL